MFKAGGFTDTYYSNPLHLTLSPWHTKQELKFNPYDCKANLPQQQVNGLASFFKV